MDTKTVIKGLLVFGFTFGFFVMMKQASPPTPSRRVSYQNDSPEITSTPVQPAPVRTYADEPTSQPSTVDAPQSDQKTPSVVPFESSPQDVILLIGSWRQAIVANDSRLETSYYAPTVKNYYGHLNVNTDFIEADKQAFIDHGNQVTGLALQDVTVQEITPESLEIRLIKNVTWQGAKGQVHRLIPSTLNVEKLSDGWKITGERDKTE